NFYKAFFIASVLIFSTSLISTSFAGYWFQFGVRGGQHSTFNDGASVNIQTITNQKLLSGSAGYWVGENLANGAFIQIGYLVENQTGVYPSFCNISGCGGYENLTAGNAEWFYEYFPPGFTSSFLGKIGSDGSAGVNGTINNYAFYSNNSYWYFLLNGNLLGKINLSSNNSGENIPIAFGELANTSNAKTYLPPVIFNNLNFYKNNSFFQIPNGYVYIGYGEGSQTQLSNPYGVQELLNRINYFEVGSNLPQYSNNYRLWTLGYSLEINSTYGNFSGKSSFVAYSKTSINVPNIIYLNNQTRVIFEGWVGKGFGSYTGINNYSNIYLDQNITETAQWQKQYYLSINSSYGQVYGSGWYNQNTLVNYSLSSNIIYQSNNSRVIFSNWNNGNKNLNGSLLMSSPEKLFPNWQQQYLININSSIANISKKGWYNKNSLINITLKKILINSTPYERTAFYSWNNGAKSNNLSLIISSPLSLSPIYKRQYLTTFKTVNEYGDPVYINKFELNNNLTNNTVYLYSGINYSLKSVFYKGTQIYINKSIAVEQTSTIPITIPLYNLNIKTNDLFGLPVNALVTITFYNGTTVSEYSGTYGLINMSNVPFGFASGIAEYGPITTPVNVNSGNRSNLLFISLINVIVFILIIVISAVLFEIASRHIKHNQTTQ
ncbi:MAG: hypothetical protein QXD23_03755, partial [Candidatus Micrarchaeaceae archaeon]